MKLLTKAIEKSLPALYSTEDVPLAEKVARVKFFTPWSNWTWYGVEYDPATRTFFGLVSGLETEWGYFSLDELASIRGKFGLKIERDLWFKPTKVTSCSPAWVDRVLPTVCASCGAAECECGKETP